MQLGYSQEVNRGISMENIVKISTTEVSAINHYTRIIENNPTNVKYLMLRSDMYRSAGMMKEAMQDLNAAISINPFAEIYTSRAVRRELYPSKKFDYIKSDDLANEDPFFKSFVLMEQYQEYESAIEHFDMAIHLDPNFVVPYHNRAVAYKQLGKYDLAEKDFAAALKIDEDIAKIHFGKARLMTLKGDNSSSKYYYNQAMKRSNYYPEAVSNYSTLLKSIGEYTDALIEMDVAIDDNPDLASNYYVRAGIHFVYGDYKSAIADLDKYIDQEPQDAEAMFSRGMAKMLLDQPSNGCYDMEKGLDLGYTNDNSAIYWYLCDN